MSNLKKEINRYQLFEEHQWIIRVFVAKGRSNFPVLNYYEGLESELAKELWRVALRFDPKRGAQFSTLAYWRLNGSLIDLARRTHRYQARLNYKHDGVEECSLDSSCQAREEDPYTRMRHGKLLKESIEFIQTNLEDFARKVVMNHLFEERSLRWIARHHGCSYSRVRTVYLSALADIRAKVHP